MSTEEQQLNGEVGQDWDEAASDEGVWPPPPNAPDPLAEYDDFLADLVRAPRRKSLWTQAPWSRLRLVRELRRKTGMHLRPCQDVVNSFCDRYAIFPKPQGFRVWGMHLATTVLLGSYFLFGLFQFICHRMIRQIPVVEVPALARFAMHGVLVLGGLMVLACGFVGVAAYLQGRCRRREAEEARKKLL